jgi:hypothetical protein
VLRRRDGHGHVASPQLVVHHVTEGGRIPGEAG